MVNPSRFVGRTSKVLIAEPMIHFALGPVSALVGMVVSATPANTMIRVGWIWDKCNDNEQLITVPNRMILEVDRVSVAHAHKGNLEWFQEAPAWFEGGE